MQTALLRALSLLSLSALVVLTPVRSGADSSFDVSLSTLPLTAISGHTFSMDFQFIDGSPIGGNGNNVVTLSNFVFGSGSTTPGTIFTTGGVSGDLVSGLTLTDTSFFNEFTQDFTPGNLLGFHVAMTGNVASGEDPSAGGTPDEFSFAILDNGSEISSDPSGGLFLADVTPGGPDLRTFPADSVYGGITPSVSSGGLAAVPEPQSWGMGVLGLALLGLAWAERRGRQRRSAV